MHGFCIGACPRRSSQRRKVSATARKDESTEDTYERRLKESQKVEERVEVVFNESEVAKALEEVGQPAVLCLHLLPSLWLELQSTFICEAGISLGKLT